MGIISKVFDRLEEALIVICLGFMTVMNFLNVVSRYCFANSFSFTEELVVLTFVWVSMLGIAAGYKRVAHLGMSYVVEIFPKKQQAYFVLFSMICSLAMIGIMVYQGVIMVQGQIMLQSRTPALGLPSSMQGLAIPVGGVFIAIRTLQAGITGYKDLCEEHYAEEEGNC